MRYQASIVEKPRLRLRVCRAEVFPEGIGAAWERLEEKVGSLRGRRFYGVTIPHDGDLIYYAGVEPRTAPDRALADCPQLEIDGGCFARVKVQDWSVRTDEVAGVFDELIASYDVRSNAPAIEFYRSHSELYLLVPLIDSLCQ